MAFRHGRFAEISVGGNDLSAYCDSADLSIDVDTSDTTTFGSNWKTAIEGLAGATVSLSGNYDPTASTGPAAVFFGLIGNGPAAVVLDPGGNVAGQTEYGFSAILTNYGESTPVADKITFSASLIVTGVVSQSVVAP